jgi:hypothetical protein
VVVGLNTKTLKCNALIREICNELLLVISRKEDGVWGRTINPLLHKRVTILPSPADRFKFYSTACQSGMHIVDNKCFIHFMMSGFYLPRLGMEQGSGNIIVPFQVAVEVKCSEFVSLFESSE